MPKLLIALLALLLSGGGAYANPSRVQNLSDGTRVVWILRQAERAPERAATRRPARAAALAVKDYQEPRLAGSHSFRLFQRPPPPRAT